MELTAARIREQGVEFAVVLVKPSAAAAAQREATQQAASRYFPGLPVMLCSQDSSGRATYYGRQDIARFLSRLAIGQIPWKKFHAN